MLTSAGQLFNVNHAKEKAPLQIQRSSFQPKEQKRWLVKYLNCRVACSPFTLSSMSRAKILDPKILQSPAFPNPSLAASQVSWDFPDFPEFQWFLTEATAINRRVHQDLAVNLLSTMPGALRYQIMLQTGLGIQRCPEQRSLVPRPNLLHSKITKRERLKDTFALHGKLHNTSSLRDSRYCPVLSHLSRLPSFKLKDATWKVAEKICKANHPVVNLMVRIHNKVY